MKIVMTFFLAVLFVPCTICAPLKIAVAGVTHDHIAGVVSAVRDGRIDIVGVYEKDSAYLAQNALRGLVPDTLFFGSLPEMLDRTAPEAVVAYGSIYDHLETVEQCAPRHVHVMVEKPLAVSSEHALRMKELADSYGIHLLTNYETCWYASNHTARSLVPELGKVFRIEVYDGHQGPIEIGCSKRFTDWLTDPKQNGGGAVTDFGCYGANLATWLMDGEEPLDVYAVLRTVKPETYSLVDDDATIVLRYKDVTVQIMASWCWPFGRKDMYIYGTSGSLHQKDPVNLDLNGKPVTAPKLAAPYDDSFRYLEAVICGNAEVKKYDMASLDNNLLVVRILEAAKRSSVSGHPEKTDVDERRYDKCCLKKMQ